MATEKFVNFLNKLYIGFCDQCLLINVVYMNIYIIFIKNQAQHFLIFSLFYFNDLLIFNL